MSESSTMLNSTFKIGTKLGAGSFGRIYAAINVKTQEEVAIKVEDIKAKSPQLLYEAKIYQHLVGDSGKTPEGIAKFFQCTTQSHYNLLVIERLGSSLEDLFTLCGRQFSLKTVLMLAEQMLNRVEFIHSKGFLHRDIKPDNFVMGKDKGQNTVYIVDFGLSKKFMKEGKHNEFTEGKKLTGTARYASINTHKGFEQGRRDDLESLCYVWVYFLKGTLPWQGLKANDKEQRYEKIKEKKIEISAADLCEGLPTEFADYLSAVRNLRFEEKPDYNKLKQLFINLFSRKGYTQDFEYDWVVKVKEGVIKSSSTRTLASSKNEYTKINIPESERSGADRLRFGSFRGDDNNGTAKSSKNDASSKVCLSILNCFS